MKSKEITVVIYKSVFPREDWKIDFCPKKIGTFLEDLSRELAPLGVKLDWREEDGPVIEVNGYSDLLNAIRIRSPRDGLGNPCLGHVIGASPNRNPLEDLRRGINRVAFAPETVEPDGAGKVVCHNCGCGC